MGRAYWGASGFLGRGYGRMGHRWFSWGFTFIGVCGIPFSLNFDFQLFSNIFESISFGYLQFHVTAMFPFSFQFTFLSYLIPRSLHLFRCLSLPCHIRRNDISTAHDRVACDEAWAGHGEASDSTRPGGGIGAAWRALVGRGRGRSIFQNRKRKRGEGKGGKILHRATLP